VCYRGHPATGDHRESELLKRIVAIRTSALAVNAQTRVPGEHEQEVFLIRGLVSRANFFSFPPMGF